MKFYIRDGLWLSLVVGLVLAWSNDSSHKKQAVAAATQTAAAAVERLQLVNRQVEIACEEADVLSNEVRRLRGVVKSSLADKRKWFELEVDGRKLVAIHPAISESKLLTLEIIEKIESETGLEAQRLRHFFTPISELQIGDD